MAIVTNMKLSIQHIIKYVTRNKRHLTILLLGFSSGLPAALTASTLQAWFTQSGINLQTIGAVTFLVLPYSLRFFWAPFFDHVYLPGLDRRRSWLFLTQVGLVAAITAMAFFTPQDFFTLNQWSVPWLMVFGFITAFFSTSQDIVINAYQIEVLPPDERGIGAAVYVTGWRIGAIVSGALALLLASLLGWHQTYLIMATLMSIGLVATLIAPSTTFIKTTQSLFSIIVGPFQAFFQRFGLKSAVIFLLLILTYKASDALALALNTTFLLRKMGFDLATVGIVNKTVSLISALLGGLVAGIMMTRISLYRALIIFGFIQGFATLSYALMACLGKSLVMLVLCAFSENFFSGMGNIALVALLMALCDIRYTATQFALLSATAFIARTFVGPVAATLVEHIGWAEFFIICFLISLPTLFFVYLNKNVILDLKNAKEAA